MPLIYRSHEARAIATSREKMPLARPLTCDLFPSTLLALETRLLEMLLTRVEEAVFYAQLIFTTASRD